MEGRFYILPVEDEDELAFVILARGLKLTTDGGSGG